MPVFVAREWFGEFPNEKRPTWVQSPLRYRDNLWLTDRIRELLARPLIEPLNNDPLFGDPATGYCSWWSQGAQLPFFIQLAKDTE